MLLSRCQSTPGFMCLLGGTVSGRLSHQQSTAVWLLMTLPACLPLDELMSPAVKSNDSDSSALTVKKGARGTGNCTVIWNGEAHALQSQQTSLNSGYMEAVARWITERLQAAPGLDDLVEGVNIDAGVPMLRHEANASLRPQCRRSQQNIQAEALQHNQISSFTGHYCNHQVTATITLVVLCAKVRILCAINNR